MALVQLRHYQSLGGSSGDENRWVPEFPEALGQVYILNISIYLK